MGGGSLISSSLGEGEGEGGEAATKAGVQAGVETILTADCRDQEGHGDGSPSRKWRSTTSATDNGRDYYGGDNPNPNNYPFCHAYSNAGYEACQNLIFQPDGAPPLILVLTPSWLGGPHPIMSGRGIKAQVYHQQ